MHPGRTTATPVKSGNMHSLGQQLPFMTKLRIDKWLWAARFFRTRAKAREAIDGGKIHINGQRAKPAKELIVGNEVNIRQGRDEKTVIVTGLNDQRKGAPEAALLYEETPQSIEKRALAAAAYQSSGRATMPSRRPSKKDRRQLHKFKEDNTL